MNKLSEYLNKNGSDKCTSHSFAYIYDGYLGGIDRNAELDILESGVFQGASLFSWREYFPNARITGVDIQDIRKEEFKRDDIEFVLSDIKEYIPDRKFDFIIEDGSHSNLDALWSGVYLSKHLKDGGILIIEDIQEGFMIPFLLWGQLGGAYVVNAIDMRRLSNQHGDFVVIIHKVHIK